MNLNMTSEEIRNNINLKKDNWINEVETNCYAYALGLDVREKDISKFAYIPGTMSSSKYYLPKLLNFTYDMLMVNIFSDLDFLGIDYKEIKPKERIKKDEWKIAMFVTNYLGHIYDYHFLRYKNGVWYHKNGYGGLVSKSDSNGSIIINPKTCYLNNREYDTCFKLKLK